MSYTPYYIADYEDDSGLDQYHEPFLIPDKAFPTLEDSFIWRGKVLKRRSVSNLGRLRRVLSSASMGNIVSAGSGTQVFNIFTGMGVLTTEPNAQLQPGSAGTPLVITIAGGWTITDNTGDGSTTVVGGSPIDSATINYSKGELSITFSGAFTTAAATITCAYYPSLPVMGLRTLETSKINSEPFISFDTKYAYSFNETSQLFQELVPGTTWSGNDSDFFWSTNYWYDTTTPSSPKRIFWATNFYASDPIRYYNGTSWTDFAPILSAGNTSPRQLIQARILIPFQDSLIALNTYEKIAGGTTTINYTNRIRFSQIGTSPLITGVLDASSPYGWTTVSSWADDIPGYGGYIDLPTSEVITSAAFVKNTLLIKCERSSYKIVFTGIVSLPFTYEKINTELGSESTFSSVQFDNGVITVGNYGITIDDSVNVQRIDRKIPDFVFNISNTNNGVKRVYGIRDFVYELVYWTCPISDLDPTFPNAMLVYNYKNQSFSVFNDSYTCFGYYQRAVDLTWATLNVDSWSEWNLSWNSSNKSADFPDIIAGNQQGFVSIFNQTWMNDPTLSITDITYNAVDKRTVITSPNHNLQTGNFVRISDIISDSGPPDYATSLNDTIYKVIRINGDTFNLISSPDPADIVDLGTGGTYIGNGRIAVLNNINIYTKVFAPFYEEGSQARLGYVDFLLDNAPQGQVVSNIYVDESTATSLTDKNESSAILGSNIVSLAPENLTLLPYQEYQKKIWHRQFVQAKCQNFQIQITMSDDQMFDETIIQNDFVLHALVLYVSKNARLTQ